MFEGTQGAGDLGRVDAVGQLGGGAAQMLRIGDAVTLTYHPPATSSGGSGGHAVLEWCGGSDADMVADAVVAVVLGAAGAPPGLEGAEAARRKALAAGDSEGAEAAELGILTALLGAQFGPARVDADQVGTRRGQQPGARCVAHGGLAGQQHALAGCPRLSHLPAHGLHGPPLTPSPSQSKGLAFVEVDGQHVVINAKSGKVQCANAALRGRVEKALARMHAALMPCDVSDLG